MASNAGYLVVERESGDVFVVDGDKLEAAQAEYAKLSGQRFVAWTIVDLDDAHGKFAEVVRNGSETQFTLRQVSQLAGVSYDVSYKWLKVGILRASLQGSSGAGRGRELQFSYHDGFTGAVLGALARQGCERPILLKARKILRREDAPAKQGSKKRLKAKAVRRSN